MPPWRPSVHFSRACSSLPINTWNELIRNPTYKYHIYFSRSNDPFLNLSIEHYLLENSHKDSTVLFLYTNSPCVVIGRNQNPWLEVNLQLLKAKAKSGGSQEQPRDDAGPVVQLVRRRSGGGTVFHDEGNINYSVICPPAAFTRNKHAEMVTRAMRKFNPRARVNERHDIVLDQGKLRQGEATADSTETHTTRYLSQSNSPLKVSGSAFKLTRNRSLHHGTCLLASPNLSQISKYLHSPARPYMKAKGVESVRSPVGNVFGDLAQNHVRAFETEVVREFVKMYNLNEDLLSLLRKQGEGIDVQIVDDCCYGYLDQGMVTEVHTGIAQIKVSSWRSLCNPVRSLTLYNRSPWNGRTGRRPNLHFPVMPKKMLEETLHHYQNGGLHQ